MMKRATASVPISDVAPWQAQSPTRTRLVVASFLMDLCGGVLSLAIPLYAVSAGAAHVTLGLLGTAQKLTYISLCTVTGRLSDRISRKHMVLTAIGGLVILFSLLSFVSGLAYLFVLSMLVGAATSIFWPPLMTWVGSLTDNRNLAKSTSTFNVAWSTGVLLGTFLAGWLFGLGRTYPFLAVTGVSLLMLGNIVGLPDSTGPDSVAVDAVSQTQDTSSAPSQDFLPLAWAGVFVALFAAGTVTNLFPKLGADLAITPTVIGLMITAMGLTRTATFYVLGRYERFTKNQWPLVFAMTCGVFGSWLFVLSSTPHVIFLAFLMLGITVATGYSYSLFYSLSGTGDSGHKAGIHEAMINGGAMAGSFVGGIVAQLFSLRAPYIVTALVLAIYCFIVLRYVRLARR